MKIIPKTFFYMFDFIVITSSLYFEAYILIYSFLVLIKLVINDYYLIVDGI